MKARLITGLIAISFSLQSQFEPFEQFFHKTLWNTIPAHDSITLWYDSVHPNNLYGSYRMNYSAPDRLDSMVFHDHFSQEDQIFYSGKTIGNMHVVASFSYDEQHVLVPFDRTTYVYDQEGRVSELHTAYYDGSVFVDALKYLVQYRQGNLVDAIQMQVWVGSGHMTVGTYNYYYSANNDLDSVLMTTIMLPIPVQKYQAFYDNGGRIKGMDLYDSDLGGGWDLNTKYLLHYDQGTLRYVDQYAFSNMDSALALTEVFEYSRRNNSNIGIKEQRLANVEVYPNPTADLLYIQGEDLVEYRLFDLGGRPILEGEITESLDLSQLSTGQYLLYLRDKNGRSEVRQIQKG